MPVMLLRAAHPSIDARDRPERSRPYRRNRERGSANASHRRSVLVYGSLTLTVAAARQGCPTRCSDRGRRLASPSHDRLVDVPRSLGEHKRAADNPLVEARRADPWSLVHSNQSLSKIITREQIVESHRGRQPNRNGPGWRRSSIAAREWAASNATDRMERVSQDPL
jgi:hypothetical protein